MLTWTEALKLLPADEAEHPEQRCRGCAGMGYGGEKVTPRVEQLLKIGSWRFTKGERAQRYVRITPHRHRARGVIHAPFVIVVAVIEGLESDPAWTADPSNAPISRDYACPWCHGTGKRTLSAHTLETEVGRAK